MICNPQLRDDTYHTVDNLFESPTKRSVCDFVENHVQIPTGAITGPMNLDRTPHAREILERFADKEVRHLVIVSGTQLAKALALDTPLPTPNGWTTVGDLKVGDQLIGRDGRPTTVLKKTKVFHGRPCYRVTFGGGSSVVVDEGHLWAVTRRGVEEVVETRNLRVGIKKPHRVPVARPLELPAKDLPIEPYTLGVWLGDGHSAAARMTCHIDDLQHYRKHIYTDGYQLGVVPDETTVSPTIHGITHLLRGAGLLNNKHIPPEYLRASEKQRWALLQGLMDTDGTCAEDGRNASFTTTRPELRDGIVELLRTLGFKPRTQTSIAKIEGREIGEAFRTTFHPDGKQVFRLKRKQDRVAVRTRQQFAGHEIVSVERVESVPVQCIAVDEPDHLFLCGSGMIPTHNTTMLICGMLYWIAEDPDDAMWVFGNSDQARDFNKERFMEYVKLCEPVMDLVPRTAKGVIDKNKWGFKNQHYLSMVLNFVGAGSRTNLSSRPRGRIVMDETDKYHEELKFDAGTIQLAEERQKSFPFPISVKASSPSEAHRMIWVEFLKSDMRKYHVPCPRCEQRIVFQQRVDSDKHGECGLRWWHEHPDEAKTDGEWDFRKVAANAYYKPPCCGGKIHDFERYDMLHNGIWIPSNKNAEPKRYGYHAPSFLSLLGPETSFGGMATKFLTSKGNKQELKNYVNGWLAEPWEESMAYDQKKISFEVLDEETLAKADEATPLMAVDFQENGFWALVRKFSPPTDDRPYGESFLVAADWYQTEDEWMEVKEHFGVLGEDCVIDMAKRPNQAAKIIIERGIRGMWGSPNTKQFWHQQPDGTRVSRPYSIVHYRDPMLGTAWENRTFERAIYVNFSKEAALDAMSSLRYYEPTIWHSSANVNPRYARHINAFVKRMQRNQKTGRIEAMWVNVHNEDHLADAEAMVTIRAIQKGLVVLPPTEAPLRM